MGELVMRRFVRRFNGNTINGNNFDKAHLKAYLKGHQNFRHGYDNEGNPIWYKVQAMLYVEETPLKIQNNKTEETNVEQKD